MRDHAPGLLKSTLHIKGSHDYSLRSAMKEFGYSKGNLAVSIVAFVGVMAFIFWKHGEIAFWFAPVALGSAFLHFIYPLAKVTIDAEKLKISYPYPFRKSVEIEHHNVESYNPVKMKRGKKEILIMGFITPAGGKAHMIWGSGTKDFEALSGILEGSYPRKDYTAELSPSDNADTVSRKCFSLRM